MRLSTKSLGFISDLMRRGLFLVSKGPVGIFDRGAYNTFKFWPPIDLLWSIRIRMQKLYQRRTAKEIGLPRVNGDDDSDIMSLIRESHGRVEYGDRVFIDGIEQT